MQEKANAAAELWARMDLDLQNAFFTCYKTYGKIATKKLISCFSDDDAINAAKVILQQTNGLYEIPNAPSTMYIPDRQDNDNYNLDWLDALPVGPGVSPCVHNTCKKFLQGTNESKCGQNDKVSTLCFLQDLCGTAVELRRVIANKEINVAEIIAAHHQTKKQPSQGEL